MATGPTLPLGRWTSTSILERRGSGEGLGRQLVHQVGLRGVDLDLPGLELLFLEPGEHLTVLPSLDEGTPCPLLFSDGPGHRLLGLLSLDLEALPKTHEGGQIRRGEPASGQESRLVGQRSLGPLVDRPNGDLGIQSRLNGSSKLTRALVLDHLPVVKERLEPEPETFWHLRGRAL